MTSIEDVLEEYRCPKCGASMLERVAAKGAKWRGRKPRARHPNHAHHKAETGPLIKFDIE